tara:strand:- start:6070 stop:7326 length:1257 start_codon:yes stop_codon:yes gene_type:complete
MNKLINNNRTIANRITSILFASKTLHSTALVGLLTVTPIISVRLTGSDLSVGLPATLVLVGRAIAGYPMGWLMDRLGRRKGLNIGLLISMTGMALGALGAIQSNLLVFLSGSFVLGMSKSAIEQMRFIAAEVQPIGKRAQAIGLIAFSSTVGSLLGSVLMDSSPDMTRVLGIPILIIPFFLGIVLMVMAMIINHLGLRPDPASLYVDDLQENEDGTNYRNLNRSMLQIFSTKEVVLACLVMAISWLGMTVVMQVTPLFMSYEGYDVPTISRAVMIHSLGMFILSSFTGWLTSVIGRYPVVGMGIVLLAISGVLGCYANTLYRLYVAVFLLGVGWNFCYIAGSAMLSDELQVQERGRAQGISEAIIGITAALGSVSSGLIFSTYGYVGSNLLVIIFSFFMMILFIILRRSKDFYQPSYT